MSYRGNTPSTLSDALRYVKALYGQAGLLRINPRDPSTGIEWLQGERYEQQEGAPPRLFFEQMAEPGKVGPVLEVSARQSFSITETCVCHIWGAETADDADRYDAAKALGMQLLDAFKIAAPGYLAGAALTRADQTNIVTFGEEYVLVVQYTWAVPRDEAMRQAAVALAQAGNVSDTPQDPDRPNGGDGSEYSVAITLTNTRP